MNPKLFLVAALACLLVDFSSATFPLTFASNGIWASPASLGTASVADAALPSVAVSGGAVLLGALGLTIGKALLLRRLTGVSWKNLIKNDFSNPYMNRNMSKYISFIFPYFSVDVDAERLFLKYLMKKQQDTLLNFFMNTNKLFSNKVRVALQVP